MKIKYFVFFVCLLLFGKVFCQIDSLSKSPVYPLKITLENLDKNKKNHNKNHSRNLKLKLQINLIPHFHF